VEHQGRGLPLQGSFWRPRHSLQPSSCARRQSGLPQLPSLYRDSNTDPVSVLGSVTTVRTSSMLLFVMMVASTSISLAATSHGGSVCATPTSLFPLLSVLIKRPSSVSFWSSTTCLIATRVFLRWPLVLTSIPFQGHCCHVCKPCRRTALHLHQHGPGYHVCPQRAHPVYDQGY
jgi:hypothetical protein